MGKPIWSVDQIVENLNRNGEFWQSDTITYSFLESYPVEYAGTGFDFQELNGSQRYNVREALQVWDDVIAVSLESTSGPDGDLRFGGSRNFETAGAALPGTVVEGRDIGGDVWVHPHNLLTSTNSHPGSAGHSILVHEIGHALGFEHPGEYNSLTSGSFSYENNAEYQQDSMQYTAMSYFTADETGADHTPNYFTNGNIPTTRGYQYPATPLLHDIAAAQAIYGADMTTRTGDTVYGFNSNTDRAVFEFEGGIGTRGGDYPVVAIWDAGGKDTLDFSGYTGATTLSLGAGSFSSTEDMTNNVAIAFGVEIENGIGGSGDDYILGNALDNLLEGGDGNDTIVGLGGNDSLIGGAGFDTINGNQGGDYISGGADDDLLNGNDGDDTLLGGDGGDVLLGEIGDDTLEGGEGDDTLHGDNGADLLTGGVGDDELDGGAGADDVAVFSGNRADYDITRDFRGKFTIADLSAANGHEGTDTLVNVEWLQFADQLTSADSFPIPAPPNLVINGVETADVLVGDLGNDTIFGLGGDDLIQGRDGDDLLVGDAGRDRLVGGDGDDTLRGGDDNDQLEGDAGNDLIEGDGGNDRLYGGAGDDTIKGGDGNDFIFETEGANLLYGDAGNDSLQAGDGADSLFGGADADVLKAGGGDDFLQGDEGNDTLLGGVGDDQLLGGADDDSLLGGAGSDSLSGGEGNDWHDGGDGTDTVVFSGNRDGYEIARDHLGIIIVTDLNAADGDDGEDRIALSVEWLKFADQEISTSGPDIPPPAGLVLEGTSAGNDLFGGLGDDVIFGRTGDDELYGGEGDDTLMGEAGNDSIFGGQGVDTVVFQGARSDYQITVNGGVASVLYQGLGGSNYVGRDTIAADVERFAFSDGVWVPGDLPANSAPPAAPVLKIARSGGSRLHGNTGDDTLIGRGGKDRIYGHEGDDLIGGGSGNDVLVGGLGSDTILGESGRDKIYGGEGGDYIHAGSGADRVFGHEGDDVLVGHKGNDKIYGGEGNDTILGGSGRDKLYGQAGDDLIFGNKHDNKIYGQEGNDTLVGGKHKDKIYGQEGDDTIYGANGDDKLYGHDGNDYIEGGNHNNKIYGGAGDDTLIGGKHVDKIYGHDGDDLLTGGSGKDTLYGGAGDDTYFTDGRDKIRESFDQGEDTIVVGRSYGLGANFENLDLTGTANINGSGNSLNNYLWGNSGNNGLYGGAGEDTLDGWLGNDLLVGGDDSDVFLFGLGEDEGEDIILDFNRSEDVLAFGDVFDGAGDDLADIDAQIISIVNEGDGGDVVVSFTSGTELTLDDFGSGTAGTLGSIGDLVDDSAIQIVTASSIGLGVGFITVEGMDNELDTNFHLGTREG